MLSTNSNASHDNFISRGCKISVFLDFKESDFLSDDSEPEESKAKWSRNSTSKFQLFFVCEHVLVLKIVIANGFMTVQILDRRNGFNTMDCLQIATEE